MSNGGGNGGGNDGGMAVLGELICDLNPYTERTDEASGRHTGKMDVLLGKVVDGSGGKPNNASMVELEVDAQYAADWAFKGQPQRINRAVRIKYRYPVYENGKTGGDALYWIEDYVLLGFEGAGGN